MRRFQHPRGRAYRTNPTITGDFTAEFPYERWAVDFVTDIRATFKKEEATAAGPVQLSGRRGNYTVYVTFYETDFILSVWFQRPGHIDLPFTLHRESRASAKVGSSADVLVLQPEGKGVATIRAQLRTHLKSSGMSLTRIVVTMKDREFVHTFDPAEPHDVQGLIFALSDP